MKQFYQRGFTLIEVVLSIAIGLMIVLSMMYAARSYNEENREKRARLLVESIRKSIEFYRQRCGTYPTLAVLATNDMSNTPANCSGAPPTQPFHGDFLATPFPVDPYLGVNAVSAYTALNNPLPSGTGGWEYDVTAGAFRMNLRDSDYGLNGAKKKLVSNPSSW